MAIAIGAGGLERLGIPRARLGVVLEPGEGTVAILDAGAGAVLAVVGGDAAGTQAAALTLGARAPHIWDPEGPSYADVSESVQNILAADEVGDASARVTRILAHDNRPGLRRLDVEVRVARDLLGRAEAVLRRAGGAEETEEAEQAEEAASLQFEGLRLLRIYLSAPGVEPVIIHVEGPTVNPARGSGRRPGGRNKSKLALSNLYTNDGFLGDSDENLIPDRVDVVLSAAGDTSGVTADLAARIGLEASGVAIPIALTPDQIDDPEEQPPLVLIGLSPSRPGRLRRETCSRDRRRGPGRIGPRGQASGGAISAYLGAGEGSHHDRGHGG
jgi:hypothetical protein